MKTNSWIGGVLVACLFSYISAYIVMSRVGMQRAAMIDSDFYCFVEPNNPSAEQFHMVCCDLFAPCITIDRWLGSRFSPAACPRLQLSRAC
ncbi:hypothetical protein AB1L30_21325 [Bremerella sp. JC817]|uniref:hypothetical protein n=1 Tax=Bremerella sp. JC817 TaxID=3231756 RepID=UPI0034580855